MGQLTIHLPDRKYTLDNASDETASLRNGLSDMNLYVKVVSFARTGDAKQAEVNLAHLLSSPAMLKDCQGSVLPPVQRAKELATCKYGLFLRAMDTTLDSNSASASGTLTINNGDNIKALFLLLAAAEVARVNKDNAEYSLLKQAFEYQKMLQYDEPAPFFYAIGETLAGYLLRRGTKDDLDEAEEVLRTVLFLWPRSALASLALHSVLEQKGQTTAAAYALAAATRFNDTRLTLAWL